MIIKDIINFLEENDFNTGDFKNEQIYNKKSDAEIAVAAYARISSEDGYGKDISIERQFQTISNFFYNFDNQLSYIDYYKDIQSGTNSERPNYRKLLNDCKIGKVNIVVTASFNRLGRDSDELLDILYKDFYHENVIFIALREKIINSISNKFKFKEIALEAEKYCKDTSKAVRQALKEKAKGGSYIGSKAPFGYIKEEIIESQPFLRKKNILLKANDGTAEIVKGIYLMYLDGKGYDYIANYLNNKDLKSPNLAKWSGNTVKSILTNPLYAGVMAQGRYSKKGYKNSGDDKKVLKVSKDNWVYGEEFQGIVSKKIFEEVQMETIRRNSLRRKGDKAHLFTGILKCGDCGSTLVYKQRDNGYKCSKSQEKGSKCTTHFVKEEELFNAVNEQFKILLKKHERELLVYKICNEWQAILGIKNLKVSIKYLDKQIKSLNKKIDQAYMRSEEGTLSIKNFIRLEKNYLEQVYKLESQKENLIKMNKNSYILRNRATQIINDLIEFKYVDNTVLRNLIKEIRVYQSEIIEISWNFNIK